MRREQAAKVLAYLGAMYPNVPLGEATVAGYIAHLADWDFDAAMAVARRHVECSRFFPTIAELRAYLAVVAPEDPPGAIEAWAEVIELYDATEPSQAGYRGLPLSRMRALTRRAAELTWPERYDPRFDERNRAFFVRAYEELRERAILEDRRRTALGPSGVPALEDGADPVREHPVGRSLAEARRVGRP